MFAEDLSVFLNSAEFATDATLDWVPVKGIFDAAYAQAFDGIATTATAFTMASADCHGATHASVLIIGAKSYRVRNIQPDGTGLTVLLLERTT
jgi:hypothetical protein